MHQDVSKTPALGMAWELHIRGDRAVSGSAQHRGTIRMLPSIHVCPASTGQGLGGWQRPRQTVPRAAGHSLSTSSEPSGVTLSSMCQGRSWKGRAAAQVVHRLRENLQFPCPPRGQVRGLELWQVALGKVFQRRV